MLYGSLAITSAAALLSPEPLDTLQYILTGSHHFHHFRIYCFYVDRFWAIAFRIGWICHVFIQRYSLWILALFHFYLKTMRIHIMNNISDREYCTWSYKTYYSEHENRLKHVDVCCLVLTIHIFKTFTMVGLPNRCCPTNCLWGLLVPFER